MADLQDHPGSPDDVIDIGEAARIIGVHPATVRRWIDEELLPGGRAGTRGWRRTTRAAAEAMRTTWLSKPRPGRRSRNAR
jgi:hypothetical protein